MGAPPKKLSVDFPGRGGKCCRKTIACLLAAATSDAAAVRGEWADDWWRGTAVGLTSTAYGCTAPTRAAATVFRTAIDASRFVVFCGRDILQRSQVASPLRATARNNTVQRRANASCPLSAPFDVTATAKRSTNSTPTNVPIRLIIPICGRTRVTPSLLRGFPANLTVQPCLRKIPFPKDASLRELQHQCCFLDAQPSKKT